MEVRPKIASLRPLDTNFSRNTAEVFQKIQGIDTFFFFKEDKAQEGFWFF